MNHTLSISPEPIGHINSIRSTGHTACPLLPQFTTRLGHPTTMGYFRLRGTYRALSPPNNGAQHFKQKVM